MGLVFCEIARLPKEPHLTFVPAAQRATMKTTSRSARRARRSGVTAVEVAVCLPVLLTMVFVLLEYSRIQLVNNLLNNACRAAARIAATDGVKHVAGPGPRSADRFHGV